MKKQKKLNNKGFSMVELVIVIAIMAVLIAVLAPQYIKYVESSRVSTDDTNAAEILKTVQLLVAEGEINKGCKVTWKKAAEGGTFDITVDSGEDTTFEGAVATAVKAALSGEVPEIKSKTYDGRTYDVTVAYSATDYSVSVKGEWSAVQPQTPQT